MKIATWNVNGLRARRAQFLEWIQHECPDVVCLQEIKASQEQLADDLVQLAGYRCCWHCEGPYSGVSLNLREEAVPANPPFEHPLFDRERRVVTARVGQLIVASVYVPNGGKDFDDKLVFLQELQTWVSETLQAGTDLIVCGDMNVTRSEQDVHPRERNERLVGQRPVERELFAALLGTGLTDLGRALHEGDEGLFTWWAPWRNHRQRNIGWRLDYVLVSDALAKRAVSCIVRPEVGTSDHAPVVAAFEGVL